MTTIAPFLLCSGCVMFLASLPLVFRKVPMNPYYGIRLRASFTSERRWYDINEYAGRQFAAWSWLVIATGSLGLFIPREYLVIYAWASLPLVLSAVAIPAQRILAWLRQHPMD